MKRESLSYWGPFALFLLLALGFSCIGLSALETPPKTSAELVMSIEQNLLIAERHLSALETQLSEQSARIENLNSLSETLQEQLTDSEMLIGVLETQLTNSEQRATNLQQEVSELRRQHFGLTDRYKQLSQQFENYESEVQQTMGRLTTERNILRGISIGLLILAAVGWAL